MGRAQKREIIEHLQNAVEDNDWEGFCSHLLEAKKGYGDDVIDWAVARTYDPTYIRYVQALMPFTSSTVLGGEVVWSAAFVGDASTLSLLTPYADEETLQRAMEEAVDGHHSECVLHLLPLIDCTYKYSLPLRLAANYLHGNNHCEEIFDALYKVSDPHVALAYMKTRNAVVTIAATKVMEQIVEQRSAKQLKDTLNAAIDITLAKHSGGKKL